RRTDREARMDGYIITPNADDAWDCYGLEGVRHVAELASGEGFVAFDGAIPFAGGLILEAIGEVGFAPKIRRHTPFGGDGLVLSLITSDLFRSMSPEDIVQVTLIPADLVLVLTHALVPWTIWGSRVIAYRDVRVEDGEVVAT